MSRTFLRMLAITALLWSAAVTSEAQDATARSFKDGPLSVTIFDGTGRADAQYTIDLVQGQNVEVLSIPVDVRYPPSQQSLLIVDFIGHFVLPTDAPVDIALDCTIDHEINLQHGCGITPGAYFDFTNALPPSGAPQAVIPSKFLIRDVPVGVHQIGIAVHLSSRTALPMSATAHFTAATSSLVVSLYASKEQ